MNQPVTSQSPSLCRSSLRARALAARRSIARAFESLRAPAGLSPRRLCHAAGAVYTRYADDLAFFGGPQFTRAVERFASQAAAIVLEEDFDVNHRKTRVMRRGVRQHLAGMVVNQRINITRRDIDILKAMLTNCVREGPNSQNRDGHPAFQLHSGGRVGFVESVNPEKGACLRQIYEQIQW